MSNKKLEQAILDWVSVFKDLKHKPENFESLADGVTLTEIMLKIEPKIFDMSKLVFDIGDNRALRHTNLAHLYDGLEKYYTQVLEKYFNKNGVDIIKVSQKGEKEQLYKLIELVIGATIQGPCKESYIKAILSLEGSSQDALMDLIEKWLPPAPTKPQKETRGDISELLRKLEELEAENVKLGTKLGEKAMENEELRMRIQEFKAEERKKSEKIDELLKEREEIQEKVNAQESIEELKNEMRLKDHKVEQMEQFVEEIKRNYEREIAKLENEIEKQKRKVGQLSKVEATVEYYTQKYEDYTNLQRKVSEMEEEFERSKEKMEEMEKRNEKLQKKMNTYKEKLEGEQTRNISLDIELTKRKMEIESLKSEKKRLEAANLDLEERLYEADKVIEKHKREYEDMINNYERTNKAVNQLAGQDFGQIVEDLEKKNKDLQFELNEEQHATTTATAIEGEKEILQQENDILKNEWKRVQLENEALKKAQSEDMKIKEKLSNEKNDLKEEIEKLKQRDKTQSPSDEHVVDRKKYEEEIAKKNELQELNDELETVKSFLTEAGEQKDKELKILIAAVQELAVRNLELEKQVMSKGDGPAQSIKLRQRV